MGSIAHSARPVPCFLQGDQTLLAAHSRVLLEILAFSLHLDATLRPWLVLWLHLLPTYRVSRLLMVARRWLRITESVDAAIRNGDTSSNGTSTSSANCRLASLRTLPT